MKQWFVVAGLVLFNQPSVQAQAALDYDVADPALKVTLIDSHPTESFLAVRADTTGRLFVGGREALFVYEPDDRGGYQPRRELVRFPNHTWVYDIEIRGHDLYVLTVSALYVIPDGVVKRADLQAKKLIWGVPMGHVHQCFHGLAWGPEGDLYISMGDPLWYYGDFERPDHWGYWTFHTQGAKVPYHGVGGVFRCKPDGSDFRIVATGLRNSCGLAFDRHWNLFTNDNDHEGIPSMYVPGRLVHVTPHGYFSWPRGWMQHKTPERTDLLETMCNNLGRFVPTGQSYYHDTLLPAKYRDNLLVARWCTRAVTRYPLEERGASFKTEEQPLLVGKNLARPVGVSVGRGGRIFTTIAFMAHNEASPVYRSDLAMITTADDSPAHAFEPYDATQAPPDKLWAELTDVSWQRRYRAHIEMMRRGGAMLKEANQRLAKCRADDPALHSLIWLAASSQQGSLATPALLAHSDPRLRAQAVRALTEFSDQLRDEPIFARLLIDADRRVRQAALLAYFNPKLDFSRPIQNLVVQGPARSKDTYLRQPAAILLAKRASLNDLELLCESSDAATRMAGILAVGFRLTVPTTTAPLAVDLPLAKWRNEVEASVIDFADGKLDLRKHSRVGTYTLAEHWKAAKRSAEQERMFGLLRQRLKDADEQHRLQSAFFLALVNDPRSEPEVARVRTASAERKLSLAPLKVINQVWVAGPFADAGKGMRTVHPPERGPIDLGATLGKVGWKEAKPAYRYDLKELFGPCEDASFYAFTRLESAGRTPAQLLVGSDDGIKVWHNGKLVFAKEGIRAALPYQDVVPLELQPGGNDLLVRVNNVSGDCALYLHYRALGPVALRLPEKLDGASLAERLKNAPAQANIGKEFLEVDWIQAATKGDALKGRQLFGALACAKCHAVANDSPVSGGPSLADARKRFTVPYLVESILTPGKQVSPVFKASQVETKAGKIITGLVLQETAEKIEILLGDATRVTVPVRDIETRRLLEQSPMAAGVVRTPRELGDLLAYLLSEQP